jgi:hypothetical protein
MRIIELGPKDLENINTKKDFKKLLKEKYDATKDKELQAEILGVNNE